MDTQPVRIQELLAHAGWVRKLAARLVRDAGTADDVSQEVWTQALRSPPRDRENLRAWLAAAVRNAARSLKRAEKRRLDHEAAVEIKREEPPASELVERAQLHRHLVEQVLALPEPQRSIVLAHWFEGQSVAEIARRQHLTARVAKLRLDEGHALLRQRMDKSPGGRSAWCLAFTKWLGPNLAPVGAGTAFTVGGIFVASKVVIATAVVVVAATVGGFLWPTLEKQQSVARATNAPESWLSDPITEAQGLAEDHAGPTRESLASAAQTAPVIPATSTAPRWVVRGHTHGAPAGLESQTKLTAVCVGRFNIQDSAVAQARADGSFEIDVTAVVTEWLRNAEPQQIQIVAQHPSCVRAETSLAFDSARLDADSSTTCHEFRCDFNLVTAAIITGRVVVPPDWTPIPEDYRGPPTPRVGVFDFANGVTQSEKGIDHVDCDADGNWTLRVNRGGSFTLIACAEGLRPKSLTVNVALGKTTDVGVLEFARGNSISGTVRRAGAPVEAGAVVIARWKERADARLSVPSSKTHGTDMFAWGSGFEFWHVRARTRADGSYSLDGLAPGEYEVRVERMPGVRTSLGGRAPVERVVQAPQTGVDLEQPPPTIELAVTVGGRPPTDDDLDGVKIDVVPQPEGVGVTYTIELTRSASGYGKIQLIAGVAYELRVVPARYSATVLSLGSFTVGEARTVPLDLIPENGASVLVLRFVGTELENLDVVMVGVRNLPLVDRELPDWPVVNRSKDGTFVVRGLMPGNHRVHVRAIEEFRIVDPSYFLPLEFDIAVPERTTLQRELRPEIGGRVRLSAKNEHGDFVRAPIELRDDQQRKIKTEFYCVKPNGRFGCGWYLCEEGLNDHPALAVGHYELTLSAEGLAKQIVPIDIVRGQTQTIEVVLHPQ